MHFEKYGPYEQDFSANTPWLVTGNGKYGLIIMNAIFAKLSLQLPLHYGLSMEFKEVENYKK